jgi:hypothetical protein
MKPAERITSELAQKMGALRQENGALQINPKINLESGPPWGQVPDNISADHFLDFVQGDG